MGMGMLPNAGGDVAIPGDDVPYPGCTPRAAAAMEVRGAMGEGIIIPCGGAFNPVNGMLPPAEGIPG